jgi:hypothetical protein
LRGHGALQRHVTQQSSHCQVLFGKPLGRCTRIPHRVNISDLFGRKAALCGVVETEPVATEEKLGDMPASIGPQLADARCAGDDFVSEAAALSLGRRS